jgi:HrpA-like RNA helicase
MWYVSVIHERRSDTLQVVDEVHERSLENDILLLELKNLLKRNKKIKV